MLYQIIKLYFYLYLTPFFNYFFIDSLEMKKYWFINYLKRMNNTSINLGLYDIINIEKVSSNFVSKPFIFNNSLFLIRNGSIVQYN